MDDMEQKINSILGNPEMMAQLMNMAQSIGLSSNESKKAESSQQSGNAPISKPQQSSGFIDIKTIQKVAGFAQQAHIDRNQQALLKALGPYLTRERIQKLEKAMRAAKIAGIASSVIGNSGTLFQTGR